MLIHPRDEFVRSMRIEVDDDVDWGESL